jgi:hypothetical protein
VKLWVNSIPFYNKARQQRESRGSTPTGMKPPVNSNNSQYIMRDNPERIAWLVLLASFFVCVGSAVALPLGIRSHILYSTVGQQVTLDVQRPPVRVTLSGRGEPVAVDSEREIPLDTLVATNETAGRLVFQESNNANTTLATVQLYDYTEAIVVKAQSPRFESSALPHTIELKLTSGRLRLSVPGDAARGTTVIVNTDHGQVTLEEGTYDIKVSETTTEATVRNGQASIRASDGELISLSTSERAIVEENRVNGPLPAARNLIKDGDFQTSLDASWNTYREQKEDPPAEVEVITEEGVPAASFYRIGSNHAEVGIYQELDYDVRDFSYLELRLAVDIIYENIAGFGGCGTLSSECPIMVRIDYKDIDGTDREWLQGFYIDEPASDWLIYPWTQQLSANKWQTYDSGNLMEQWVDNPPAAIQRVTVYASGHSFHALITDLELLAEE